MRPGLAAIGLLVAACASGQGSATTLPAPSTTSTGAPSTTGPRIPTTVPESTTTTDPLPDQPTVSGGWSLQSGDLLVSGRDGVIVIRNGAAVSQPVRSPVEVALSNGFEGIVFTTPRPELFPDHWPMRGVGGGYIIWGLSADGSLQQLHQAEEAEWEIGGIDLVRVDAIPSLVGVPSLLFTQMELIVPDDPYQHAWERIWVLPLSPQASQGAAVKLPIEPTSWEGGFSGLGWQEPPGRLLLSWGAEGFNWFAAYAADGTRLAWPTNPADEGEHCPGEPGASDCWSGLTTIPTTSLIAYFQTDPLRTMVDLVIYDTAAGVEQSRVELPVDEFSYFEMIHASATQIAVSRLIYEDNRFQHRRVLLVDIETGSFEELTIRGIATLVP